MYDPRTGGQLQGSTAQQQQGVSQDPNAVYETLVEFEKKGGVLTSEQRAWIVSFFSFSPSLHHRSLF